MAENTLQLNKFSKDGKEAGQVEVSSEVFGIEPNVHVLHQAVRRELANGRAGTACPTACRCASGSSVRSCTCLA